MIKKLFIIVLIIFCTTSVSNAEVEVVPIYNPVYKFLQHCEVKGLTEHFSLTDLPLQKKDVLRVLQNIDTHKEKLSSNERGLLNKYLIEFDRTFEIEENGENIKQENAELYKTSPNNHDLLWANLMSDYEKSIVFYADSNISVKLFPQFSLEYMYSSKNEDYYSLGQIGGKISGTLYKYLGFSLQATNGPFFKGSRELALDNNRFKKNVKFGILKDDIDLTTSQVIFYYDWIYAGIERVNRTIGAGLRQKTFLSDYVPPVDAITCGVNFKYFKYRFSHSGLIGYVDSASYWDTGYLTKIPPKYMVMHRFTFTPKWGEVSFWESIIYSDRAIETAYLNPLSFMKSLEHSLHERDNSLMGIDGIIRPFNNFQLESSFLLDDVRFEEIGNDYWSNKYAFNIAAKTVLFDNIDFGIEYSRVEPYTYTHFNNLNSFTSDSLLIGSYLYPNSDQIAVQIQYWFNNRYPISLNLAYTRHGDNVYDEDGKLIKNVGGEPNIGHRYEYDSQKVKFLDGIRNDYFSLDTKIAYELVRNIHIDFYYGLFYFKEQEKFDNRFKIMFKMGDF
jgi:hypothetical protein